MEKEVRKAYDRARKSASQQDMAFYNKLKRQYKARCNRDKKRSWQDFKLEIDNFKDTAFLARLAQHKDRVSLSTLETPQGTTMPGIETINLLQKTHFPAATAVVHTPYTSLHKVSSSSLKDLYQD